MERAEPNAARNAMQGPDRPGGDGERPSPGGRPPLEERHHPLRDALLRPMHLLMVAIGAIAFAFTLAWWVPPLTLATYAALVFLAVRYPPPQSGDPRSPQVRPPYRGSPAPGRADRDVPTEQRVRRLPQGEIRQKVEAALEARRRTLFAVEVSDDTTRAALSDTVPKLDQAVGRLVDIALARERITRRRSRRPENEPQGAEHDAVRDADAGISAAIEELSTVRARVVRISSEDEAAVQDAATELNADLDALNLRLDALIGTLSQDDRRTDR